MANRLSENPNWSVLLLEAGDEESMITDVPLTPSVATLTSERVCLFVCSTGLLHSKHRCFLFELGYNWGYKTEPSSGSCLGLRNGVCNWPK